MSQAHGHHHTVQCFCLAALQRRLVLYHSRWLLIVLWPWPSVHLGQLAPTTLPQCRLVSNPCSAGLSLSLSLAFRSVGFALFLYASPTPSLSVSRPVSPSLSLSLSLFVPRPLPLPLCLTLPLSLCLPLSLSVSRCLSPSSPFLFLPLLTLPRGFSCASASSYTPLLAVSCQAYRRSHGGVLNSV